MEYLIDKKQNPYIYLEDEEAFIFLEQYHLWVGYIVLAFVSLTLWKIILVNEYNCNHKLTT